ncbi:MAG: hypothetical protein WCA84_01395 [Ignavibacteriaceae bacterium]|jgi:L-arabinose isomerase
MIDLKKFEVWFVTGSQDLYGEETLIKVAEDSQEIVKGLSYSSMIPVRIEIKPVLKSPDAIYRLCLEANNSNNCVGLITWMHTFSPAINVTIVDMGNRFRMITNEISVITQNDPLPNLSVARAIWMPKPNIEIAAHAWILAGGAHHFGFSQAVTPGYMEDFAEMNGIEYLLINESTNISEFKKELRWNDIYYMLK